MEAERVLGTPELLTGILEAALPKDQVSATVVCQAWNEQAVRVIWRDVPSVIPLLKLLALPGSMRKNSEGHWEYTSSIEYESWARLSLYGRYVHTLVQFRDGERATSAAYQAVAQAAMGRPAVLPNLRKIVWTLQDMSAASGLTILCSSSVRALELDMSLSPIATVLWVFRNLRGRIQNIRELSIGVPERMSVQNAEDSLSELLKELPKLESIELPMFWLSEKIMTALGSHEELKRLTQYPQGDHRVECNPRGCKLRFDSGSFPVLEQLECNMALSQATGRFRTNTAPRTLSSLYIGTRQITTGTELKLFLDALVSCNPGLQEISLNLYTELGIQNTEVLVFDDLSPLLGVHLKDLTIGHRNPLSYKGKDIITMVQSWPDMRYLSLNEEVVYNDETGAPPGLDLTDLTFFTEFPQLQVLGVFLWIGGDFKAIKARPSRKFSELQTLHVGTSAIPGEASINEVAVFVASLMSNKDMEISRDTSQWFPDWDFQDEDNEQWDEVSRLMTQYYTAQRSLHQNLDDTIRRLNQEKAARILSEEQCHALEAELKVQRELVSDLTARQRELEQELAGLKANLPSQEWREPQPR